MTLIEKQKFVNEIGKAYEDIGFVALKGHFLSDTLVDNLYAEIKNFFDLPIETKRSYEKTMEDKEAIFPLVKKVQKAKKKAI